MIVHPTKGRGRWIFVSSGGEISVWDVEKVICREIYRPTSTSTFTAKMKNHNKKSYEPWHPDDEAPETLLTRFASTISETNGGIDPQPHNTADHFTSTTSVTSQNDTIQPITALHLGIDSLHNSTNPSEPNKAPFLISGGGDRILRFWDITRPEASAIISAPNGSSLDDSAGLSPPKARYEISHPTAGVSGQTVLIEEHMIGGGSSGGITPSSTPASGKSKSARSGDANSNKLPRNTVISAAQQALLRSHLDGIMDVCVLERPYGVVVSVDRGGGIYVFQ